MICGNAARMKRQQLTDAIALESEGGGCSAPLGTRSNVKHVASCSRSFRALNEGVALPPDNQNH